MKRWIVLFLLMVPLLAFADSYWEGDAVLQRGDAAFESGLYAASNSFAPDTQLMVQNLENGKSTVVTVSQRMDSQSDILILLSPKAADAVGIPAGGIARVRITVVQKAASTGASASPEGTVSPDSDVNPAAAYAATPGAPQTAQPGQEQQPAEQAQQPAAQEQVPAAAQAAQPAAAASPSAEDAQILAEAASRNPQKDLFLPPREDQKFAYKPPSQAETAQTPQPAQAETPTVSGETAAPSPSQSEVPLAEAQPQKATTQETVTNGGAPAAAQSGQIALSAPETPPEQPAQAAPAQPEPRRPSSRARRRWSRPCPGLPGRRARQRSTFSSAPTRRRKRPRALRPAWCRPIPWWSWLPPRAAGRSTRCWSGRSTRLKAARFCRFSGSAVSATHLSAGSSPGP